MSIIGLPHCEPGCGRATHPVMLTGPGFDGLGLPVRWGTRFGRLMRNLIDDKLGEGRGNKAGGGDPP